MKQYEALVILQNPTRDEGIKEALDRLAAEITTHGGRVETIQKMDRKPFARVANRKHSSGFYVNVIFEIPGSSVQQLRARFAGMEDVFRVMISQAAPRAALPA